MKAIILAAGYATRLFPLTQNFPKPLLKINNRPMIDYIVDKIEELNIQHIYVVTNSRFEKHFINWAKKIQQEKNKLKISIINDKTTSNSDRLGAIGDIHYTIKQARINEDLIIVGGDNLFKFSLQQTYNLFKRKQKPTIVGYDVQSLELAKKYAVIKVDQHKKVISFVEKPKNPESTQCAICVYFYPKYIIPVIEQYLSEGNNKDAPGNLPAWLIKKDEVYAQTHSEQWFDIGGFESLKEAKEQYGETNINMDALRQGKNI